MPRAAAACKVCPIRHKCYGDNDIGSSSKADSIGGAGEIKATDTTTSAPLVRKTNWDPLYTPDMCLECARVCLIALKWEYEDVWRAIGQLSHIMSASALDARSALRLTREMHKKSRLQRKNMADLSVLKRKLAMEIRVVTCRVMNADMAEEKRKEEEREEEKHRRSKAYYDTSGWHEYPEDQNQEDQRDRKSNVEGSKYQPSRRHGWTANPSTYITPIVILTNEMGESRTLG
ncbi:hypothetical protein DBV05_g12746 [Lasiodiplodia theobromae]|uniref:Uncharacterized protein n=1 Tax=Lasiodiplodia theobromae TaxID=45133 RepID=A0A5N5CTA5_9PEZI|nr:hypothetical protein DBV05_g12746 [Lasiodiplodia theobromae]